MRKKNKLENMTKKKKKERWANVTSDALDERDVFLRMCGVADPFILTKTAFRLI